MEHSHTHANRCQLFSDKNDIFFLNPGRLRSRQMERERGRGKKEDEIGGGEQREKRKEREAASSQGLSDCDKTGTEREKMA